MPTNFDKTDITDTASCLATPLTGGAARCNSIALLADDGNGEDIFWGDKNVQNFKLEPGDFDSMPADSVEEIFVKATAGTQIVHVAYSTK